MDTVNLSPLDALNAALELVSARIDLSDWSGFTQAERAPFEALNSATIPTGKSGTLKAWMTAHHGAPIYTLQIGLNGLNPWAPGARMVDAKSRASSVILDGSHREYAGAKVIASDDKVLIISTVSQVVMYVTA